MKLGTKFFVSLALPVLAAVALLGYLGERRGRMFLHEELKREGRAIARSVQQAVEVALRDSQVEDVHRLVDVMSGYERILGIRIYDRSGAVSYASAGLADVPPVTRAMLDLVRTGRPRETLERVDGSPVFSVALPLSYPEGHPQGAVEVFQLEPFIEEDARDFRSFMIVLTVVIETAMGFVLFLVARHSVTRPVSELVDRFREVGSGLPSSPVLVERSDELGHLAREFDAMCARLSETQSSLLRAERERSQAEERLRRSEHLASLGRLTAGLAHEIGTPLNVIGARAEALRRRFDRHDPAERNLRIISAQIERIVRIVRDLLDFARARQPRLVRTEIGLVIRKVLDLLEERSGEALVRIAWDVPGTLPPVAADADQLYQVFLNLAMNALDAMKSGGTLSVSASFVRTAHPEEGGAPTPYLAVTIKDSGIGIPPEDMGHLFEPFFTRKEIGQGTGLGLAVSYGIVRDHGGWIQVESKPGDGTRATVFLPAVEEMPQVAASTAETAVPNGRSAVGPPVPT